MCIFFKLCYMISKFADIHNKVIELFYRAYNILNILTSFG